MKATDLMIGDFVFYKNFKGNLVPHKIIGISETFAEFEDPLYDLYKYERMYPIPLTPEILEKNGFEKSVIQTVLMKEQQIPPTIRYGIQLGEYSGVYISFGLRDCPLYDIRSDYRLFQGACIYVHELQHALRLCEIEKEIVL